MHNDKIFSFIYSPKKKSSIYNNSHYSLVTIMSIKFYICKMLEIKERYYLTFL